MALTRPAALVAAALLLPALAGTSTVLPAAAADPPSYPRYSNPVSAGFADTFADPAVVRGEDGWWYAYGTTDPLREGEGTRHLLPFSRSKDLVDWTYVGDAFTEDSLPAWADRAAGAALWAPDVVKVGDGYRLYYVVTSTTTTPEANDSAIGMATGPTPAGPWTDSGGPVVGPRRGAGGPGDFLWTFDPAFVQDDDGSQHLFYGSYYGGIFVTELDASGTRAVGEPVQVAIDNKFEGAYVVRRNGFWYLFASTANCCAGPTTGYSVQVGRSREVTGPYVDRDGVPLLASRAGGTPSIVQNGNRWIGAGHNAIVTDLSGQDWALYHAIDRFDPYLDGTDGINERPMLLDRLDWLDGWPLLRAGRGPSEGPVRAPVTTPGAPPVRPALDGASAWAWPVGRPNDRLDTVRSDEFSGRLTAPWQRVRDPQVSLRDGGLIWPVEATDLVGTKNDASLLVQAAPTGGWVAETRLRLDLGTDEVRNFEQAGLVVLASDDRFVRLSEVAIWNTRQTEFGHERPYVGRLSYGGTIVGPPGGTTTWLRVQARPDLAHKEVDLVAFTSRDGRSWVRGGTWTLPAGTPLRVGLAAHGDTDPAAQTSTARFDYFRLWTTP